MLYVIEVETWVSSTLKPFTSDTVEDYWYVKHAQTGIRR